MSESMQSPPWGGAPIPAEHFPMRVECAGSDLWTVVSRQGYDVLNITPGLRNEGGFVLTVEQYDHLLARLRRVIEEELR